MSGFARTNTSALAEWSRSIDATAIFAIGLLISFGFILSLAAGPVAAERIGYADPFYLVYRHAAFALLASLVFLASSFCNDAWTRRAAAALLITALALMIAVLLVGHEAKGASRWLRLAGFSFQPSEIGKPALVVTTAWLLSQRHHSPDIPWASLAAMLYVATLGLLLLQPDVGQAALLSATFVVVFFVSGLTVRWVALFAICGSSLSGLLYALLPHVRYRVHSFLNPEAHDTYQVDTALRAIAAGGPWGVGPGEGVIKSRLPDAHTDFVFAVAGEEFGVIACAGLVFLYAAISIRGIARAAYCKDPFQRAAATGLFALFALQAAINIGVNLTLIPPKGMTLPLVSYGGSSMIGSALTLGFALSLTRRSAMHGRVQPLVHSA